jgi:TonB family protein
MEFKGNIIFSIVLHAMIFTAALGLAGREIGVRPSERFISVGLIEDHADDRPLAAGTLEKKKPAAKIMSPSAGPRGLSTSGTATAARRFDPAQRAALSSAGDLRRNEVPHADEAGGAVTTVNAASHHGEIRGTSHGPLRTPIAAGIPVVKTGRQEGGGSGAGETLLKMKAIRAAIEKVKSYPPLARERGMEGTVTAEFTISTEGYPKNIRIVRSSGYEILDAAARRTLLRASPFPPVQGRLEVPITFKLER